MRGTFSLDEESANILQLFGENYTDQIENLLFDEMTALIEFAKTEELCLNEDWKTKLQIHQQKLDTLFFKVNRLFLKRNNDMYCEGWFARLKVIGSMIGETDTNNVMKIIHGTFQMGIEQFFSSIDFHFENQPITKQYLLKRFTEEYCNKDDKYYLKKYEEHFEDADQLEISTCQNYIRDIKAFDSNGEMIDYDMPDSINVNTYINRLNKIAKNKGIIWKREKKERGTSIEILKKQKL